MDKRIAFLNFIEYVFSENTNISVDENMKEDYQLAKEYFNKFKFNAFKGSNDITENGKKILFWMQENVDKTSNIFTSKEIAEALFTSGRSVAGSMRKLVTDGYVEKAGGHDCNKTPVTYSLTEAGKGYQFEN